MPCHPATRDRHARLRRAVRGYDGVVAVDTIPASEDPSNHYTTELVLRGDSVRPQLLGEFAAVGVDLVSAQQRGEPTHTVVIVR